jgi:(S)-ureidoglycine aminohydrolase
MNHKPFPSHTRNVLRRNYALITPDGFVPSTLPGWTSCLCYVIISATMGARLVELIVDLEESGHGSGLPDKNESFLYIISGRGTLNQQDMVTGSYAYIPPQTGFEFSSGANGTRILIFQKVYEPIATAQPSAFLVAHEKDAPEAPFLGDWQARLKPLLPDSPGADMAVNIFTYDPGATLPFVETHVMEHGMLFLDGSGIYRLDEDWRPVQAGDSIWIAPYCPQWFIAAGPDPARYIYYKDINRSPL